MYCAGTPVTGGNVSLYNETKGEGIYPTPVLGIVGIIDDVTKAVPSELSDGAATTFCSLQLDAWLRTEQQALSEFRLLGICADVCLERCGVTPPA